MYDGEDKTSYDQGSLTVSTHRLLWSDGNRSIEMPLKYITKVESHGAKFTKSAKVILTLSKPPHSQTPGPVTESKYDYIKLSFVKGGHQEAEASIRTCLTEKRWEKGVIAVQNKKSSLMGGGLVRIEQQIESSRINTDQSLNTA